VSAEVMAVVSDAAGSAEDRVPKSTPLESIETVSRPAGLQLDK